MLFLVLVYVFNFNLFEFLAAILEKGLLLEHENLSVVLILLCKLWNALPLVIRSTTSLSSFEVKVKTFLFRKVFN